VRDSVILDKHRLKDEVAYFLEQDAFFFDVETMPSSAEADDRGIPKYNDVVWLGLATYGKAIVIPMGHPNGDVLLRKETRRKNKETQRFDKIPVLYDAPPKQLLPSFVFETVEPLLFSKTHAKSAHNEPFDVGSVAKYYGEEVLPGPLEDTIMMQHLLNENMMSKGLKELVKRYYKVVYDHDNTGKCIEKHPFSKVAHYLFMDVRYGWLLRQLLRPQIDWQDRYGKTLTKVNALETDLLPVLVDMNLEGAPVEEEELIRLEKELSDIESEILTRTYRVAGKRFNLNAAGQKAEVLFSPKSEGGQGLKAKYLTDGGKKKKEAGQELGYSDYTTKAEILEDLYATNPLVSCMLEYAETHKLLSTYVQGYLGVSDDPKKPCRIFNGRIHADLVAYGTVTGRFSCREPNLQNIPRPDTDLGKKIRGLFKAPPGYKMVVADYGQIEMILLAHFIGRGALYEGIHNGMDPHSATGAGLIGMDPAEFMRLKDAGDKEIADIRQVAKGVNFAVVYGAGPAKVGSMASVSENKAKEFLETHQQTFPEIYRFKDKVLEVARARRPPHIRTIMGRKRRLPALLSRDRGSRGYAERQAVNSLIQGSAADIIKLAMVRLHSTLEPDMRLILSVHDELVTLVPEEKAERCAEIVREAMLGDGVTGLLSAPLSSDLKIVDRWSEAK
jgi:DNA polymerase I-like protein with 3'-5' exonuclease and polymerase domains